MTTVAFRNAFQAVPHRRSVCGVEHLGGLVVARHTAIGVQAAEQSRPCVDEVALPYREVLRRTVLPSPGTHRPAAARPSAGATVASAAREGLRCRSHDVPHRDVRIQGGAVVTVRGNDHIVKRCQPLGHVLSRGLPFAVSDPIRTGSVALPPDLAMPEGRDPGPPVVAVTPPVHARSRKSSSSRAANSATIRSPMQPQLTNQSVFRCLICSCHTDKQFTLRVTSCHELPVNVLEMLILFGVATKSQDGLFRRQRLVSANTPSLVAPAVVAGWRYGSMADVASSFGIACADSPGW